MTSLARMSQSGRQIAAVQPHSNKDDQGPRPVPKGRYCESTLTRQPDCKMTRWAKIYKTERMARSICKFLFSLRILSVCSTTGRCGAIVSGRGRTMPTDIMLDKPGTRVWVFPQMLICGLSRRPKITRQRDHRRKHRLHADFSGRTP